MANGSIQNDSLNMFKMMIYLKLISRHSHLKRAICFGSSGLFTSFLIAAVPFELSVDKASGIFDSPKEVIDQVWQIVYRDYLDSSGKYTPENWKSLRREVLGKTYSSKLDSYEAIRSMLSKLEDPYTRFLDPQEFKEMKIDTSGELNGVGIRLSLEKETQNLVVVSPIEGTPAYKAGVRSRDIIVFINGKSTKGLSMENAVKLIRGKEGTKVNLGILRDGENIEFPLERARISINAVDSQMNNVNGGLKIGYIRLKQFNANASREMRKAIKGLETDGASGYVLDLRSNPGGLLEASIDIARQWLDQGTIVSTQTREGINDIRRARGTALTKRPVVLIVNEGSASASEILSGAIKDNQRGILVGEKTFGKGLVQSVRRLSDGSGLTVTIAKYLTPSGIDIHKNGISPDIKIPMSEEESNTLLPKDLGTYKDTQYRIAETELIKELQKIEDGTTYHPKNYEKMNKVLEP